MSMDRKSSVSKAELCEGLPTPHKIRWETLRSGAAARSGDRRRSAFTLIELLASLAILGLIMTMLFTVFEQVNKAWLNGENRVETFTQARAILDLMSRELSQAIATSKISFHGELNKVYFVSPVNANPDNHADLCEVGYEFDKTAYPFTFTRKLTEPTTANIPTPWNFYTIASWWTSFDPTKDTVFKDGTILNLEFHYEDANGNYDQAPFTPPFTQNKFPSAIVIYIDCVDSRTAARLQVVGGPTTIAGQNITKPAVRSFSTTVYLPNISP
jgi:prepilin-type N-terminal cleavage/methylation domain-containing protein